MRTRIPGGRRGGILCAATLLVATTAAVLVASPASARTDACCWKMLVSAKGSFGAQFEPRVSSDPRDGGRHKHADIRGKYSFRWAWQSRGLYSVRDLKVGRRRIPILEEIARTQKSSLRTMSDYCVIELHSRSDGTVDEECVPPKVNPCQTRRSTGWGKGGSGARIFGETSSYKRIFLSVWGERPPYDGSCAHFADPGGSEGPSSTGSHGLAGAWDYSFRPPRNLRERLRGRRSFTLAPGVAQFKAYRGLRPAVAGRHPESEDGDQPHRYGGQTKLRLRFIHVSRSRLSRERRKLPRAGRCSEPVLRASPSTVQPGTSVTLRGSCFKRRRPVTLLMRSFGGSFERFASTRSNSSGSFTKRHTIAASTATGQYEVKACQRSCRTKATTLITVK